MTTAKANLTEEYVRKIVDDFRDLSYQQVALGVVPKRTITLWFRFFDIAVDQALGQITTQQAHSKLFSMSLRNLFHVRLLPYLLVTTSFFGIALYYAAEQSEHAYLRASIYFIIGASMLFYAAYLGMNMGKTMLRKSNESLDAWLARFPEITVPNRDTSKSEGQE